MTTAAVAAEAARLALLGAATFDVMEVEQQPHETPADYAARLVLQGARVERSEVAA